jgi:hypothetical protein
MLEANKTVYYISDDNFIRKAIYKGNIHICPYTYLYNLYVDDYKELNEDINETGNFLINPDYVFSTIKEAQEFIE